MTRRGAADPHEWQATIHREVLGDLPLTGKRGKVDPRRSTRGARRPAFLLGKVGKLDPRKRFSHCLFAVRRRGVHAEERVALLTCCRRLAPSKKVMRHACLRCSTSLVHVHLRVRTSAAALLLSIYLSLYIYIYMYTSLSLYTYMYMYNYIYIYTRSYTHAHDSWHAIRHDIARALCGAVPRNATLRHLVLRHFA